jgi:hypothetical protein
MGFLILSKQLTDLTFQFLHLELEENIIIVKKSFHLALLQR